MTSPVEGVREDGEWDAERGVHDEHLSDDGHHWPDFTWEPAQGWREYASELESQLDRVRVLAAKWQESPHREARKAGVILSTVLAAEGDRS